MGQPAWYWVAFVVAAAVLLVGVPVCRWLEDRADRLDREAWDSWVEGP